MLFGTDMVPDMNLKKFFFPPMSNPVVTLTFLSWAASLNAGAVDIFLEHTKSYFCSGSTCTSDHYFHCVILIFSSFWSSEYFLSITLYLSAKR